MLGSTVEHCQSYRLEFQNPMGEAIMPAHSVPRLQTNSWRSLWPWKEYRSGNSLKVVRFNQGTPPTSSRFWLVGSLNACIVLFIIALYAVLSWVGPGRGVSMVCFPFNEEDVTIVVQNIEYAASHPRVAAVLCVGASQRETWQTIENSKARIGRATGKEIFLIAQQRLGTTLRSGKGDGMNTALSFFLQKDYPRLHFYDADIVSFSSEWISKAEMQADLGYDVVRHYFPRSSTDAMITWFVTKFGFAILWPNSTLPFVEQPLGGELLLTRKAADVLYSDHRIRSQSDWGIDTLYTFVSAQAGLRIAEVYIPEGKVHALYGGLRDLRTMLVECFSVIQSLRYETLPGEDAKGHCIEPARAVPKLIKHKVGYDVEETLKLMKINWSTRQEELLHQHFDSALTEGLLNAVEWPCWSFADEDTWTSAYLKFLDHFVKGDDDWEELLFKAWMTRVLNHTFKNVMRGYDVALGALSDMLLATRHQFSGEQLKANKYRNVPNLSCRSRVRIEIAPY